MVAQPQDHKRAKGALQEALSLQAANVLQRAQLDMMATKLILLLKEIAVAKTLEDSYVKAVQRNQQYEMHLEEMKRITAMTRDECAFARAGGVMTYPDERIQAIITRYVNEIADVLLESV